MSCSLVHAVGAHQGCPTIYLDEALAACPACSNGQASSGRTRWHDTSSRADSLHVITKWDYEGHDLYRDKWSDELSVWKWVVKRLALETEETSRKRKVARKWHYCNDS